MKIVETKRPQIERTYALDVTEEELAILCVLLGDTYSTEILNHFNDGGATKRLPKHVVNKLASDFSLVSKTHNKMYNEIVDVISMQNSKILMQWNFCDEIIFAMFS